MNPLINLLHQLLYLAQQYGLCYKNNELVSFSITELSLESENCLYKIVKGDKDKIILNEGWKDYLQKNYKVIKGWIYYKIVCFLQKRNPNVPAIAFKIEAPKSRNLTRATTLWKEIIISKNINDIYTGMNFTKENYDKLGVLSIDHFIKLFIII